MTGKTHEMVGLCFGLAAVALAKSNGPVELVPSVCLCAGACVGALVPDVDHTQSKLGRKVPFFSYPIYWLSSGFGFLAKKSSGGLRKFWQYLSKCFGHRGICHSGILWLGLVYLAYVTANDLLGCALFGAALGGLSHVVADTFNPSGIPWLLPLTQRRFHLAKISTGSGGEQMFSVCVIFLNVLTTLYLLKGVF